MRNYHDLLRKNTEDRDSHLLCGGSLKYSYIVQLVGGEICIYVSNVIAPAVMALLVYKLGEIKKRNNSSGT